MSKVSSTVARVATTGLAQSRSDSLPVPGVLGRIGRFVAGGFSIWFVVMVAPFTAALVYGRPSMNVLYLIGLATAFYWLPDVINIGFRRNWKRRRDGVPSARKRRQFLNVLLRKQVQVKGRNQAKVDPS